MRCEERLKNGIGPLAPPTAVITNDPLSDPLTTATSELTLTILTLYFQELLARADVNTSVGHDVGSENNRDNTTNDSGGGENRSHRVDKMREMKELGLLVAERVQSYLTPIAHHTHTAHSKGSVGVTTAEKGDGIGLGGQMIQNPNRVQRVKELTFVHVQPLRYLKHVSISGQLDCVAELAAKQGSQKFGPAHQTDIQRKLGWYVFTRVATSAIQAGAYSLRGGNKIM